MLTLDQVKSRLQKILVELNGGIRIDRDGDFEITYNSAHVFVRVSEFGTGEDVRFVVSFFCPLVRKVPVTHSLCLHVATEGSSYRFGFVRLELDEGGETGALSFSYRILANDLDLSEVDNAVRAVLSTSESLDTELQAKFGGVMFGQDKE